MNQRPDSALPAAGALSGHCLPSVLRGIGEVGAEEFGRNTTRAAVGADDGG
ncbi:hypothetical protein F4560_001997 [Saccharothrix ecbatanensis]|uniref:Uncharacterized protein n=1 Tax=Saccharothrix ecbatanensis TaxID=1105145 RepID=A0A7W9LZS6_9PSEU|nr:hypothetical protein [Saccharothrix ecbatanensis]